MNLLESRPELTSTEIAGIVGFVSVYLAFHLAAGEVARWITQETLGVDFDEGEYDKAVEEATNEWTKNHPL